MSDNFRLAECIHTPSQLFTIYDYTKIAYIVGSFICIRELVTPEIKPQFIRLENLQAMQLLRYKQIHSISSFPNTIFLVQENYNKDLILRYFSQSEDYIKIHSDIVKRSQQNETYKIITKQSHKFVYIFVTRDNDIQVLIINFELKKQIGKGFIAGQIDSIDIKSNQSSEQISINFHKSSLINVYELVFNKHDEQNARIVQKYSFDSKSTIVNHVWTHDELILAIENEIKIFIDKKQVQNIQNFRNIRILKSIISGFIACNNSHLRIYKKSSSFFELQRQYYVPTIKNILSIELSPQQDILSFYSNDKKSIYYSISFDSETQNTQIKQFKQKSLNLQSIQFPKNQEIKTYSSLQSLFVITSGATIKIFSPVSFECYVSMKVTVKEVSNLAASKKLFRTNSLISQKEIQQFQEKDSQVIQTIAINPTQAIVAIAFKNLIRVYLILYNQLKIIKQILVSHCKEIGFNHSGTLMHVKVGGKQGTKIYLYKVHQNYELLQVLSANKKIVQIIWSKFDNFVYAFYDKSYFIWNIQNLFKLRVESRIIFDFSPKGSIINHESNIIVWGQNVIIKIKEDAIIETIKCNIPINNFLVQNKQYIFSTIHGEIYRTNNFNINASFDNGKGFRIDSNNNLLNIVIYPIKNNILLCINQNKDIYCLEWGQDDNSLHEIVNLEKRKINKYQQQYKKYEEVISQLEESMVNGLQNLKSQFFIRQKYQKEQFQIQLQDKEERYQLIRTQKNKIEQAMEQNIAAHEQETLQQVKQLQKMYQRKIAITTNKLLTSEEIGYRNQLLAQQNLYKLETRNYQDIEQIRNEYSKLVKSQLAEKDIFREQLFNLKKQYQTKISQLEQENQHLIKNFQQVTQNNINNLKKNVVNLELKYTEAVSEKYNLQQSMQNEKIQLQVLRAKNQYFQNRFHEEERRCEHLSNDYKKIENMLMEKDRFIECLEKRIQDLEKSNDIFKYRIFQMKSSNDPKDDQILKLKDNMIELEQQYDKISKRAHQNQQSIQLMKKENAKLKQQLSNAVQKQKKIEKNYGIVIEKVRDATKSPIQQIRKLLLKILENFDSVAENYNSHQKRSTSPLGQLNRVRQHLEVCLIQAVDAGKKNQKIKNVQINRKNRQNSQLLKQINDLRVKVRILEAQIKSKDCRIQQFIRGQVNPLFASTKNNTFHQRQQKPSTLYETESRQITKNKTRQSFYEKSLFKNQWKEKRLKTQQGSRKKTSHSLARNQTNHLLIQSKNEDIDELRRIIEQKQAIIKQLINKIHKLS